MSEGSVSMKGRRTRWCFCSLQKTETQPNTRFVTSLRGQDVFVQSDIPAVRDHVILPFTPSSADSCCMMEPKVCRLEENELFSSSTCSSAFFPLFVHKGNRNLDPSDTTDTVTEHAGHSHTARSHSRLPVCKRSEN